MPTMCANRCGRQARPHHHGICGTCARHLSNAEREARAHQRMVDREQQAQALIPPPRVRAARYVTIGEELFEVVWP